MLQIVVDQFLELGTLILVKFLLRDLHWIPWWCMYFKRE